MIIDFHTHTFPKKVSAGVVEKLAAVSCSAPFTDGSAEDLAASMKKAGVGRFRQLLDKWFPKKGK